MAYRVELTIECDSKVRKDHLLKVLYRETGLSVLNFHEARLNRSQGGESSDLKVFRTLLPNITYIKSEKNYCLVHTIEGNQHLLRIPLKKTVLKYTSKDLLLIHRSYCVHTRHMKRIYRRDNKWWVLCGETPLPLSESFRKWVLTHFGHLNMNRNKYL